MTLKTISKRLTVLNCVLLPLCLVSVVVWLVVDKGLVTVGGFLNFENSLLFFVGFVVSLIVHGAVKFIVARKLPTRPSFVECMFSGKWEKRTKMQEWLKICRNKTPSERKVWVRTVRLLILSVNFLWLMVVGYGFYQFYEALAGIT
ncbi:hypothetical protein RYZ26_02590 [Terasakiella sp. A23]|uniref:hypothetical protein n=1 Tax=Terasakiella sp. FCG-A23 TaxID=3080561 RepID=UPI00295583FC|nr:hypothetical protein [Terasakiella sp. A23]MDV7338468.1 hypothetical protein [Terasakiella sp. A23]